MTVWTGFCLSPSRLIAMRDDIAISGEGFMGEGWGGDVNIYGSRLSVKSEW